MSNDLNKRCASLCLEPDDGMDVFYWSDITGRFTHYEDMHFHDSFDWAWLLVEEVMKDQDKRWDLLASYDQNVESLLLSTPLQISQACLSVLGGE